VGGNESARVVDTRLRPLFPSLSRASRVRARARIARSDGTLIPFSHAFDFSLNENSITGVCLSKSHLLYILYRSNVIYIARTVQELCKPTLSRCSFEQTDMVTHYH